jgi:hypothetical protein
MPIPIVLAAGVIRMVAPTVARALIKSGIAKKATKKAVDSMKGYIPKATKKEAEDLAKNTSIGKTSTSATRPKPDAAAAARGAGNAAARAKKDKDKTDQKNIAERMAQEKIAKNLNKRNLPTTTNKPLATTGGRNVTTSGERSLTGAARRKALRERQRKNNKVVGVSKEGAKAASRASQIGSAGTENQTETSKSKVKIAPRPKAKPEAKTAPRPKPKPEAKTAPRPKAKPKAKFDTEGGLYKQYEFAKKRDLPIAGATQKYYDEMENVALNKKGGMIKKSAVKKRKGFSGRGAGAARRGF